MLKVAFASNDRQVVNQHFGAAEGFVLYDVRAEGATLAGFGEFTSEAMDGNEDKLAVKIDFLKDCSAVYVMAIGASAIKQLLAAGVQPMRVGETGQIEDLLAEISGAIRNGGVPWVDRALAQLAKSQESDRFAAMEAEGWSE
jgi:nitrogen fixation protein NifX